MPLKTIYTLVLVLFTNMAFSQTISRSNLGSAGGVVNNDSGVTLSWTVGEVFSETVENDKHITGGFQQGILLKKENPIGKESIVETPIQNTINQVSLPEPDVQITLYPNPTANDLWLKSNINDTQDVKIIISNSLGKVVFLKNIKLEKLQDVKVNQIKNFASGQYTLSLYNKDVLTATEQFLKL